MRCRYLVSVVMCVLCAVSAIGAGFGSNEEIVDCNGGDGWVAEVGTKGTSFYIISIKDTNKVKYRLAPGRSLHGWMGKGSPIQAVGSFEWHGRYVKSVIVEVSKKTCSAGAYDKIHEIMKGGHPKCSLTIECEENPAFAKLVGVEFPDRGKTFEKGEDGKIKEAKPSGK